MKTTSLSGWWQNLASILAAATLLATVGVREASGDIFVSTGFPSIDQIDASGNVTTYDTSGLSQPQGVAFDSAGNLYVANSGNNTIEKITPAGVASTFASGLNGPAGIAFDASGNLYVVNTAGNTISLILPNGLMTTFVSSGLSSPKDIAFDPFGNFFVTNGNSGMGSIEKYTPNGVGMTFASNLTYPLGIAVDGAGNVYASLQTGSIVKFTAAGTQSIFAANVQGGLADVALDPSGNLYLAEFGGQVLEYGPAGGTGTTIVSGLPGADYLTYAVPEPSAWAVVALGGGLWWVGRRMRKRAA